MSNADKRSVATDALATLGTLIDDKQKRDAIHLAVEPVIAGELLRPGEHITIVGGLAHRTEVGEGLGIVDPFLPRAVKKGDRFWFVMYPRMVHSLRHVWTHPQFPDEPERTDVSVVAVPAPPVASKVEALIARSREWLENYALGLGLTSRELCDGAQDFLEGGSYLCRGQELEGMTTDEEFWTHYSIVTGEIVPPDQRENFFTCSC